MTLPNPNAFACSPLDRAAHLRRDEAWLAAARTAPEARFAVFHALRPLLRDHRIGWLTHEQSPATAPPIFLGLEDGAPRFAIEVAEEAGFDGAFTDMRSAAMRLSQGESAILGCAKSLFEWHEKHGFCAKCGAASNVVEAGWKRICPSCAAEHFPRVDPVVIMLALHGGKCLLGRQARFPPGMHSALAGFVEPGESFEEACARELFEEAGLRATAVRYHSNQPWPFPSSLMIGLYADVENDALTIDAHELESARWFTRDEARAALERRGEFSIPPPLAIAHQLIKTWVNEKES
jgi:NAD+ diphosphatase